MATKSSFEGRRSRVSFDRVDLNEVPVGDRVFELSEGVELGDKDLQSVTWIYDTVRDSVIWSSPVEELFGFQK